MIDPTKINMNQLPKKFIDGAIGAHGKEVFSFALTSGNNLDSFATTPRVMKSISIWISKQVENYEKKYGVIDTTPEAVVSPIQASDLGKSGDNK
ncbi:hypothetical protein A2738_00420 [Candidatus Nomurabacteria bacterium RIFCSPHIGHO2_01_FULL_42_15]|uniref:DUF3467 domain-containing protein n=1 Tax=Candidatus Nomurabacteria bacterium RIFCSPHIGHO2_01_FULL_42_15 TaxID=1801742 RepID=A0A1F6VEL2_9BACT|nr:MAG: hypothetical protein A2738_00420 [Candidatus Nomurabacteria bacterium RIFCSPHIGHO2_01_FULL_42_15]OGI93279.1 MAG: hypothetical protein A3A99_04005 [Candidatus Nomurabacteria bacterium RIFCSPLOWO2_01_FULL_41_18]